MGRTTGKPKRRRRPKKPPSCATLEQRARRIRDRRKRRAALERLPERCKPPKRPEPEPAAPAAGAPTAAPASAPSAPVPVPAPPAPPPPSVPPPVVPALQVYRGPFGVRQAERLLWRAGFGPRPGQAAEVAEMGLEAAVRMLTRPQGVAPMDGPEPHADGEPLDPHATAGHAELWWLDRMVRSRHQLVERLALVLHDWFATSNAGVGSVAMMLTQSNLFRQHGLGSFAHLVRDITQDAAMIRWLSQADNRKGAINENYGRELMELFALGADRGAYTEQDVRELARALSGWRPEYDPATEAWTKYRWDPSRWDDGTKTVFGGSGKWNWEDACRLVLEHPMHPSFFVQKLWSYFIPLPPEPAVSAALERVYVDAGYAIRPVLEAILLLPQFHAGPSMVKPPVVFVAGLLRATGLGVTSATWSWLTSNAGQKLFEPPDVSGWDDSRWLDTGRMRARWEAVNQVLVRRRIPYDEWGAYPDETPAQAVATARAFWNDPPLSEDTVSILRAWSAEVPGVHPPAELRVQRQNALRLLVGAAPDHQVC